MSANNGIVIITFKDETGYGLDYAIGHCGNLESLKVPFFAFEFFEKYKTDVKDITEIVRLAEVLDRQYSYTEYGIVFEDNHMYFTHEQMKEKWENEREKYINYAN